MTWLIIALGIILGWSITMMLILGVMSLVKEADDMQSEILQEED